MAEKNKKNTALVGYYNPVFLPFAQRLEKDGFKIFWINSRPLTSQWLLAQGIQKKRICDTLEVNLSVADQAEAIRILSEFEQPGLPLIHSIILMDRILRHASYKDALLYLAQSAITIKKFLLEKDIQLVSSGRDTALQLLTMLICKKLNIFWGCVTRVKLPNDRFGFSPTHQADEFYRIRDVQRKDYETAASWLTRFRSDSLIKPRAIPKISGFMRYFVLVKKFLLVFLTHSKHYIKTRSYRRIPGSSFSFYIRNLLNEIRNYIYYRFFLKFDQCIEEPFVLYGLHRQPESSIDVRGAFFDEQLTLIKQIIRSIPTTHKLYVKVHFSDVAGQSPSFYRKLKKYPGVKLINPDINSRELIEGASVIITNSGAMGQEGGYLGKPVITMSKTFWCKLPSVIYCNAPSELPKIMHQLIESPPSIDITRIINVISESISNSFGCDPNQSYLNKTLSNKDLDVLSDAYKQLFSIAEDNRKSALV